MIRKLAPSFAVLALVAVACGRTDFSVTSVEPQEGGFFTQVLDFEGDVGHGLAMAMDAEGNPHLTYLALSGDEPGALGEGGTTTGGGTPAGETPAAGPTATPGATPSAPATVLGVPTLPAVMHAHLVDGVLTRSKVADALTDLTAEDETAIAVDAEGIHHVIWTQSGSTLWYANTAEGEFGAPEQIPLVGDDVSGLSIATGEDGTVYAAFTEGTGVEGPGAIVRLGTRTPDGSGDVETVAEAGQPGPTAVGAGAQGVIVAYGDEGQTLVARDEGDLWSSEVADEDGGEGISMALDADGNPHLAYASGAGEVKHAHSVEAGAWEVSLVGSAGFAPGEIEVGTGIALDSDGVHHVVWTDATGLSYSSNADGPFARPEQIPGTETEPAAESPRIGAGAENTVYIGWFDPGDAEVELTSRSEDAPPLALPSPSPTTGGGTTGGGAPCEPEGETLAITAVNLAFDTDCLAAAAGEAFSIEFTNDDAAPHNVAIYTAEGGDPLFQGDTFSGPGATETYAVDPIEETGDFYFQCDVHPTMNGTFVSAGGGGGGNGGSGGAGEGSNGGGGE